METKIQDLIKLTQEKKYSEFDAKTKEILSHKVADKLAEKGYFKRLDQAKGIFESENVNLSDEDVEKISLALTGHLNYPEQNKKINYLKIVDPIARKYFSSGPQGEKVSKLLNSYYKKIGAKDLNDAINIVYKKNKDK